METNVRTPMDVFNLPQHLVVPLFQRPYVWDETEQWLPLWQDVRRMAELPAGRPLLDGHATSSARWCCRPRTTRPATCRPATSSTASSGSPPCSC